MRAGWLLVVAAALACNKPSGGGAPTEPAPSGSVVAIAAAMGECADLEACARECDAGTSDRCRRMGVNFEFGKGVDRDEAHAAELYVRACGMGDSEGCLAAGRMYEFHHGVKKDDERAVSHYRRSCDLDNAAGCANLAIMLENGRGTPRDVHGAIALYDRACARGAGIACQNEKRLRAAAGDGSSD